jgi:hypothetical protein
LCLLQSATTSLIATRSQGKSHDPQHSRPRMPLPMAPSFRRLPVEPVCIGVAAGASGVATTPVGRIRFTYLDCLPPLGNRGCRARQWKR